MVRLGEDQAAVGAARVAIDHEPRANGSLPQRVAEERAIRPRNSSP